LDEPEERTYGRQPCISRADAVGSLPFDMVEEGQDDRRIQILDTEGCRLDAMGLMNESQQQAKGISVGGKSSGAGMFLVEQEVDEEGLHQARCGDRWFLHSSAL
jgi:hypothetical protein